MKEREIDVRDVVVEILLKWRFILVLMLIGATLLGGVGYLKSVMDVEKKNRLMEEQLQKIEEENEAELTETQIYNVDSVLYNEIKYRKLQQYMELSVRMNIDPESVPQAEIVFCVQGSGNNETELAEIYSGLLSGSELANEIAEEIGIPQEAAQEIATQDSVAAHIEQENIYILDISKKSRVFVAKVIGTSEENCEKSMDVIEEYLQRQSEELAESIGEHQVVVLKRSFTYVIDKDLLDKQCELQEKMLDLKGKIAKGKAAFSDAEMEYYNENSIERVETTTEAEEETKEVKMLKPRVSKTYIALGAFSGLFLALVIVTMSYIFSQKLRKAEEIKAMCEIPILGDILCIENKKHFGLLNKWIRILKNHNRRVFTKEESIQLTSSAIKIAAMKEEVHDVYVVSSSLKSWSEDICDTIRRNLEESDIRLHVLDRILYNAESIEALAAAKAVVICETVGETLFSEIIDELELVQRQNISVLGCVVIS